MTEIELLIHETFVGVSKSGLLTAGMVGVPVSFTFDESWDGLIKTAVFKAGDVVRDQILDGTLKTTVPAECLAESGVALRIGAEGRNAAGDLVIPTVWGFVDNILDGAKSSGNPGASQDDPIWNQILGLIGDMSSLTTEAKESLVAAINELAARSGDDVNEEDVRRIVDEYLAANPPESVGTSYSHPTPQDYDAVGDGSTDDTEAFQAALAENRVVNVPGGTYKLSGTLVIAENCCLELSQDTVLKFTQTEGDCVELRGSAVLRGNHAIIAVPYAFTGHVIDIDTLDDNDFADEALHALIVPPYTKSSPQWKCQRFIYDVNVIKFIDNYGEIGFCASIDGACSGTGIYISATNVPKSDANPYNNDLTFIWATTLSGIRIAGAFSYGIHAINFDSGAPYPEGYEDDGWNHDMRIEAVIEGCEIGVALENCNGAHLAVTFQPKKSQYNGNVNYAKHGVYLNDAKFIDMTGSRIWDWHKSSLWTLDGIYQHIAMIGNCQGLVLDDYLYYESGTDIRKQIYTDTPSNLEKMTILQEPITRWFKPVDGKPYYSDGTYEKPLMLREEMDEFFTTERIQGYTDALANAIDTDGSIYNSIGYARNGGALNSAGELIADTEAWYGHTGFIACKPGDTLYFKNFDFSESDGYTKAFAFDANFNLLGQNNIAAIIDGTTTGVFSGTMTDDGCTLTVVKSDTVYVQIGFKSVFVGSDPIISVNKEIKFVQNGFLADGIKVKGSNIVLYSADGTPFGLSIDENGALALTEITVE